MNDKLVTTDEMEVALGVAPAAAPETQVCELCKEEFSGSLAEHWEKCAYFKLKV